MSRGKLTVGEVQSILESSVKDVLHNQPNIFGFTPDTHQTEWNLVHHLANEIHGRFPHFDCDVDLVKPNLRNKRPDIVIHRRGTHHHNFLAIEVKFNGTPRGLEQDIQKIKTYWISGDLHYVFGAVIDVRNDMTFSVFVVSGVE
ncbi:MAG: hypothetical protein ACKVRN_11360 [Pyrinomonadaceae bacterium]